MINEIIKQFNRYSIDYGAPLGDLFVSFYRGPRSQGVVLYEDQDGVTFPVDFYSTGNQDAKGIAKTVSRESHFPYRGL